MPRKPGVGVRKQVKETVQDLKIEIKLKKQKLTILQIDWSRKESSSTT